MPVRTLLLDVDGTLLDTREFIYSAFEHTRARAGLPAMTRPAIQPLMGLPLEVIYASMGGAPVGEMVAWHRAFQRDHLDLAVAFPGAAEVLSVLQQAGVRMAAVTSRSRATSLVTLENAALARFFNAVVSAEDTPAQKPDPAPLRLALKWLQHEGGGVAMAGDTPHDIEAGRAIGAVTIAATYGFQPREVLASSAPDAFIDTLDELPAAVGLA